MICLAPEVQEAAFGVYVALVNQDCCIEVAKKAVIDYYPHFDYEKKAHKNSLKGPYKLLACLIEKGHSVAIPDDY